MRYHLCSYFFGGLFMLDEQIKYDLVLLLKKMNLCSIAREEVCNLLNNERQKPEAIKILRKYKAFQNLSPFLYTNLGFSPLI